MLSFLLIFLLAIMASFIQRVTGFGFGIFVMMFFPFFLPSYGESVTLSGLLAGSTALLIVVRNFKYIRWRIMGLVVLFNVLASFVAIEFMSSLGNVTMKRCLGVMLVLIALYFLLGEEKLNMLFRSKPAQAVIGSISGVMGGMFAMPGPPVVLYCIGVIEEKRSYLVTLQAFSVIFNIFYTFFRARVGFFGDSMLCWWAVGFIGLLIGAWLGSVCFECIGRHTLKKLVYLMMIVSGVLAML